MSSYRFFMYRGLRVIALFALMSFSLSVQAQGRKEKKLLKSIAAEAKSMESEGWVVFGSSASINDVLLASHNIEEENIADNSPIARKRYIVSTATVTSTSLNSAIKIAQTKAKAQLSSRLDVDVESTAFSTSADSTSNGNMVTSERSTGQVISRNSRSDLSKAFEVFTLYREVKGGTYEVMVRMACENE